MDFHCIRSSLNSHKNINVGEEIPNANEKYPTATGCPPLDLKSHAKFGANLQIYNHLTELFLFYSFNSSRFYFQNFQSTSIINFDIVNFATRFFGYFANCLPQEAMQK